jgi:hypothetical protein
LGKPDPVNTHDGNSNVKVRANELRKIFWFEQTPSPGHSKLDHGYGGQFER